MILSFLKPVWYLLSVFTRDDSPKQLALGVSLGIMIGLIPKGNLTAAGLSMVMLSLKVNLGSAMLSVLLISICAPQVDILTHRIGSVLLGNSSIYNWLSTIYEYPIVAWTSLNNTAVLGGLVLGMLLFYPTYHLSEIGIRKYYDPIKCFLKRTRRKSDETSLHVKSQPEIAVEDPSLDFDWKNL